MKFWVRAQEFADFLSEGLRFPVHTSLDAVTLLGLKGCLIHKVEGEMLQMEIIPNLPDKWNDTLFAVHHDDLAVHADAFLCTLEPSWYYTKIEAHPQGAARLPEMRRFEFKCGKHHGRPALIPADLDVVVRDANGNFKIDTFARVYCGNFQLRIHSGGANPNSIGRSSAGCIAVFGGEKGEPWQRFLELRKRHPFDRFPLVLSNAKDLYRWLGLKDAGRKFEFRATVHIGSKDYKAGEGHVSDLQTLLNRLYGFHLPVDGDFGPRTLNALLEAQRREGLLEPQAVCDNSIWERLEGKLGPYEDEA